MPSIRRAVIDVGTNSVKLLVADVAGREVTWLAEKSEQTRLGSGFYETHRLQPGAILKTAQAVARFAAEARLWEPASIRIIATSAARDAVNQADLLDAIQQASGLAVEVISGEQEADWVFAGVTTDPELSAQSLLILDVGGGSTEFILGHGSVQSFRQSFRFGTVRLLEELRLSDPPRPSERELCRARVEDFLNQQIRPVLGPHLKDCATGAVQLVGTGGTTSILARMQLQSPSFDRAQIEAVRLTRDQVVRLQEQLWILPMAERQQLIGLPPNRADVILTGVAIFAAVMELFSFAHLRVSTRGLRFAAVLEPAQPRS
jgi:exopolyphosphatase/guanosine-5'-triphosphate,3'-diphosphate pyrophosphatase